MRQPYRLLTLGLALCAVVAVVGSFVLLHRSRTADFDLEMGKWLLTVALALALTGALAMVVKQIDQRRSERQAWHQILNDLVGANQMIILARLRLQAHQSAKTYQEQLAEVMAARVEVRRIGALDIVNRDDTLSGQITAMRQYLDALGREYAAGYLRVARQQRLDEAWLTKQVNDAKDGESAPALPDQLAGPTPAWCLLEDAAQFPRLAALLDERAFPIDTFRTNYKLAKECLERCAGFGDPATESRIFRGRKLATRAEDFAIFHEERLGDLAKKVIDRARRLDKACDKGDPGAIRAEAVDLSKLTAEAVSVVYPEPKRNVVAGERRAAAAVEG